MLSHIYKLILPVICGLILASSVGAAEYRLRILDPLPDCTYSGASSINDRGEIVGFSSPHVGYNDHPGACLWDADGVHDLGFRLNSSRYDAINNNREVINLDHYWKDGQLVSLPTLNSGAGAGNAYVGLNNVGQIAGASYYYDATWFMHATLWNSGVIQDLGTLPGDTTALANDVNDLGLAVGSSRASSTSGSSGLSRAFLWDGSVMNGIGNLPGFNESTAVAINNSNQIVGYSYNSGINSGNVMKRAFLWQDGQMIDFLGMPGYNSYVYDITDTGKILGYAQLPFGSPELPFVWENGNITWLEGLVASDVYVSGINNAGYVVGQVMDSTRMYHAAIWEPVPEPASIIALAGGLFSLAAAYRKRTR